jgi:hypothetical protein
LSLCFNSASHHGGVLEEWRYSSTHSLTSAIDGGEWSASRPGRSTRRETAPSTHWLGGWVGSRAVLDAVVKRKIRSTRRESNPRTPIVQPVAQRYTDWALLAENPSTGENMEARWKKIRCLKWQTHILSKEKETHEDLGVDGKTNLTSEVRNGLQSSQSLTKRKTRKWLIQWGRESGSERSFISISSLFACSRHCSASFPERQYLDFHFRRVSVARQKPLAAVHGEE